MFKGADAESFHVGTRRLVPALAFAEDLLSVRMPGAICDLPEFTVKFESGICQNSHKHTYFTPNIGVTLG